MPDNKSGGTLTLKRKTIDKTIERDAKMESLRKKLKTDDESESYIYFIVACIFTF